MAGLQPVSSNIEVPESLKESDQINGRSIRYSVKSNIYIWSESGLLVHQNVIDEFSNQLPELAKWQLRCKDFVRSYRCSAKTINFNIKCCTKS